MMASRQFASLAPGHSSNLDGIAATTSEPRRAKSLNRPSERRVSGTAAAFRAIADSAPCAKLAFSCHRLVEPDEAAVLAETVGDLLEQLSGDERTIVELSLQGYSTPEISEQTGRAERSVRRLRDRVRKHLEQQSSEPA